MEFHAAPLPHEWMIASIIGFFLSWLQIYPYVSQKWGVAFMTLSVIVFMASIVSMTAATTDEEHISALAAHHRK